MIRIVVRTADGAQTVLESVPSKWSASAGPVLWDHFFHGETVDGSVSLSQPSTATARGASMSTAETPAVEITPPASFPAGMGVFDKNTGKPIALGELKPTNSPPLRVIAEIPALSVAKVAAVDVGRSFVFDFGRNIAGT